MFPAKQRLLFPQKNAQEIIDEINDLLTKNKIDFDADKLTHFTRYTTGDTFELESWSTIITLRDMNINILIWMNIQNIRIAIRSVYKRGYISVSLSEINMECDMKDYSKEELEYNILKQIETIKSLEKARFHIDSPDLKH